MDIRRCVVAALALAAAATAEAQVGPAGPSDTLDLAAAIRQARAANPRLIAADAAVAAAGARVGPAGALPDPTLTLGAMNYMARGLAVDPVMTMNQVTLMQMVPVNGMPGLRRSVAREDSARTAFTRDGRTLDVEREVRTRFWAVYHLDRRLVLLDRTAALVRELGSTAASMYAVGSASQSDVLRAQVAATRVTEQLAMLRLQRTRAAAALNAAIGRPGDAPVTPVAGAAHAAHRGADTLPLPPLPAFAAYAASADSLNPDLRAARAMRSGAVAGETLAKRMIWPDLSVGLSYGQRPAGDDMVSAMVGVQLPIFAGARQLRMRDEARAMRESAEADVSAMSLEVRGMLTAAYAEAASARAQAELYRSALLPQSAATVEAALAAYRVGRVDFMTVLDALMGDVMARQELEDYGAMYQAALAELDRLAGRPFVASLTICRD